MSLTVAQRITNLQSVVSYRVGPVSPMGMLSAQSRQPVRQRVEELPDIQFSALERVESIDGELVQVHIYRRKGEGWTLHLVNSKGVAQIVGSKFDSEQAAMSYFEQTICGKNHLEFSNDPQAYSSGLDGFNVSLLDPQYDRYKDCKTNVNYTLCKFNRVKKYTGLWPAKSLKGHHITGYLYKGVAPAWPHPPKGMPGAPANIDTEFTISPEHIDIYIDFDRGLRENNLC